MSAAPKSRPLRTVTLSASDWVHVVNAIASSSARKTKRGEHKAADEMRLIALSTATQAKLGAKTQEEKSS